MWKQKLSLSRSAAALIAALLLIPATAGAIEYGGVGGRPANPDPANPRTSSIFIYSLEPGKNRDDAITLTNSTAERKTLEVYAVDGLISSGGAFACEQKADKADDVGTWIKLSQSEVSVPAQSTATVPFTVTVPSGDVSPGEHNGCIAIQAKGQTAPVQEGGVALSTRSALRVQITVPGDVRRELAIAGYSVVRNEKGDYIQRTQVKNLGNVSIDADIRTETDFFGLLNVNRANGQFPVLPFVTGEYNFDLPRPFWGLLYRSQATVDYTAADNADKRHLVSSARWVWIWPHPIAAAIEIGILLLLLGGLWWLLRRRRFRRASRGWVTYTVKEGDTLASIARSRGISTRQLARANSVRHDYKPSAGSQLRVPPAK